MLYNIQELCVSKLMCILKYYWNTPNVFLTFIWYVMSVYWFSIKLYFKYLIAFKKLWSNNIYKNEKIILRVILILIFSNPYYTTYI